MEFHSFMKRRAPHSPQDKRNCIELEFKQRQIAERTQPRIRFAIRASRIDRERICILKFTFMHKAQPMAIFIIKLTVAARAPSTPHTKLFIKYCFIRTTYCVKLVKLVKLDSDFRLRSCNMSYVQCCSTLMCGGRRAVRHRTINSAESTRYRYNNALWSPPPS